MRKAVAIYGFEKKKERDRDQTKKKERDREFNLGI
jgi:hypothetical protein